MPRTPAPRGRLHPDLLAAIAASGMTCRTLSALSRRTGTEIKRALTGRDVPVTVQQLDGLRRVAVAAGYTGALLAPVTARRAARG